TRPPVPRVKNGAWVVNPIDAFVLAKLEAKGVRPAPPASREQLIRRLSFDLTGLPPRPEEVDAFLVDRSPGAYERVVDRLLASPAYGERWARFWLDLARYADSNGYEFDEVRPDAWRYRDYVVHAFNSDKPYNRFIQEQLAGDEIAPEDPEARIATGFNLLGPDMTDAADQAARRQNTLNDMTDTAGLVFLGLTIGCARCHDHKYEPLTQQDYYRLQAFFTPAKFRNDLMVGTPAQQAAYLREQAAHLASVKEVRDRLDALVGPVREELRQAKLARLPEDLQTAFRLPKERRTAEQAALVERNSAAVEPSGREVLERLPADLRPRYDAVAAELRTVEARRPVPPVMAMGLVEEGGELPRTYLLERGELANRGAEVSPGFPGILARSGPAIVPAGASSGRRAALAKWIASAENPLTARVLVNRVWQGHFGRGIVPSPSDFGVRGESPTHPELLDWLATEFTRQGWSIKKLHRLIVTSNAYRQSSHASPEALAADPENELFSRMNRRRLEAEAVRDACLAVSGRLNLRMGGPGVFPPVPEEALPRGVLWPVTKDPAEQARRSLYIFVRRNLHFPALEAFDSPDTNLSCPKREVTTTAPQALALMNGQEVQENARAFAARVLKEAGGDAERVTLAYRLALGRKPSDAELKLGESFIARQSALLRERAGMTAETEAWADYCLALLNLNEFVYLD
ncbi:MAG TPA: DUF1549 and DUF1553 domain-containing protein, partial [Armatimonadota bacterium]|nr:DUF1549 and DUF1553 domain-containing protein [Armatimonadota bacterium]